MAFPNYRSRFFFKVPDEWEDLGEISTKVRVIHHSLCGTLLHVGKDKEKVFQFCPMCMIKMKKILAK